MPVYLSLSWSEPQRWVFPAVLLVSAIGTALYLWWEKRRPSSYSRRPEVLASWRAMSAQAQRADDVAALDVAEAAERLAARQAEVAKRALFRP
jgi:hypothetical protein